jgi:predicted unusual protein kinase regulating ubiquinone biosynthesis (AarF/ABC1/UbiB family)
VREHVEGTLLLDLWRSLAGDAEDRLVAFLADMERHGVVHGDLHPRNLLWSGREWVLLDVDGLRHGLHDPVRALVGQWARFVLHLGDEERVHGLHGRASALLAGGTRVPWEAVQRSAEHMSRRRARTLAERSRRGRARTDEGRS